MQDQILQVINANLPAEVGNALKLRLEQAEAHEKENQDLLKKIASCEKENTKLRERDKMVTELASSAAKEMADAQEREALNKEMYAGLLKREAVFDKEIAELKAESATWRVQDMKEVVALAFRSPVYKKTIAEQKEFVGDYNSQVGGQVYRETGSSRQETITEHDGNLN